MRIEKKEELESIIEEFKVVKKERLDVPAKFIKSEVYDCTLNNGKVITREKIVKAGKDGSAAIILPVKTNGEVVLTVEPRVFSKRTVGIGIPAGYIEKGEQPYIAALRELEEETGLVPKSITNLGGFYQDMGCSAAYNEAFLAEGCEKLMDQHLDPEEYIKYFDCTYEEALELIDMGYIEGCNAIITLERARKHLVKKVKKNDIYKIR